MAVQSNLKNMLVCLTAVCLLCSAILGVVYALTFDSIASAALKAQAEAVSKVLPEGGEISQELKATLDGKEYSYYVQTVDGELGGYAVKSSAMGFGGQVVLMVGLLPDGTVYNTSVLDASGETPGLGAKCSTDEKFVSQWKGFPSDGVLSVTKDGGDVDAITASTITSRAYTKAVAQARDLVKYFGGQENE